VRVLCVGCFDIFHYGHLLHLKASAAMGSELVVGITRDRSVDKGVGRPLYPEKHRLEIVRGLWFVDRAFLCDTSLEALRKAKPDIFALGIDYRANVLSEDKKYCDKNGIRIRFTNERRMSSTVLYDRLRQGI
jgi:glycerol-3-phosphate cytidylyltransferase